MAAVAVGPLAQRKRLKLRSGPLSPTENLGGNHGTCVEASFVYSGVTRTSKAGREAMFGEQATLRGDTMVVAADTEAEGGGAVYVYR